MITKGTTASVGALVSDEAPTVDLDELAVWCSNRALAIETAREVRVQGIRPADLQRAFRVGFNRACSALEALEARGDLERVPGPALAWRPAPPPQPPGKGYALPLSSKEHGALLRLLDFYTGKQVPGLERGLPAGDFDTLRAIRSRLREAP